MATKPATDPKAAPLDPRELQAFLLHLFNQNHFTSARKAWRIAKDQPASVEQNAGHQE